LVKTLLRNPQSALRTSRFPSASEDTKEGAKSKARSDQRARRYREKLIPEWTEEDLECKKVEEAAGLSRLDAWGSFRLITRTERGRMLDERLLLRSSASSNAA